MLLQALDGLIMSTLPDTWGMLSRQSMGHLLWPLLLWKPSWCWQSSSNLGSLLVKRGNVALPIDLLEERDVIFINVPSSPKSYTIIKMKRQISSFLGTFFTSLRLPLMFISAWFHLYMIQQTLMNNDWRQNTVAHELGNLKNMDTNSANMCWVSPMLGLPWWLRQ